MTSDEEIVTSDNISEIWQNMPIPCDQPTQTKYSTNFRSVNKQEQYQQRLLSIDTIYFCLHYWNIKIISWAWKIVLIITKLKEGHKYISVMSNDSFCHNVFNFKRFTYYCLDLFKVIWIRFDVFGKRPNLFGKVWNE